jgi:hypothetical protein
VQAGELAPLRLAERAQHLVEQCLTGREDACGPALALPRRDDGDAPTIWARTPLELAASLEPVHKPHGCRVRQPDGPAQLLDGAAREERRGGNGPRG